MSINPDGHLNERIEQLYICAEYQIFLLTGQGNENNSRRAYISVQPFSAITDSKAFFNMSAQAKQIDDKSGITISSDSGYLRIRDSHTGTTSSCAISILSQDIQESLKQGAAGKKGKGWDKFTS